MPTVSAVIVTLNAEAYIGNLLAKIQGQTVKPCEILVMDSESEDNTAGICREYGVEPIRIRRNDFNHGGTRDYALRLCKGDYVLMLTQDAIPADNCLIEKMALSLKQNERMAACYGRQMPREDATYMEGLIREYNYPEQSHVYSCEDIPTHGIKTFFMSDVCAMYKKEAYLSIGGFEKDIKTNEDMLFAARAIQSGYSIGYAADARVIHSHNLSLSEQYKRNYIQGYEIERHKDLLTAKSQNSEGMKLVKHVSKQMLSKGKVFSWIYFGCDCVARYAGSYMGKLTYRRSE